MKAGQIQTLLYLFLEQLHVMQVSHFDAFHNAKEGAITCVA